MGTTLSVNAKSRNPVSRCFRDNFRRFRIGNFPKMKDSNVFHRVSPSSKVILRAMKHSVHRIEQFFENIASFLSVKNALTNMYRSRARRDRFAIFDAKLDRFEEATSWLTLERNDFAGKIWNRSNVRRNRDDSRRTRATLFLMRRKRI